MTTPLSLPLETWATDFSKAEDPLSSSRQVGGSLKTYRGGSFILPGKTLLSFVTSGFHRKPDFFEVIRPAEV